MMHVPNQYRVRAGRMGSKDAAGNNGAFFVPNRCSKDYPQTAPLCCVASDGIDTREDARLARGWEHVSVSLPNRCPTWAEMDYIKSLFWDDTDAVMQLHPPRASWVNNHPHCLHMWRPTVAQIPLPSPLLVGIVGLEPQQAQALSIAMDH